MNELNVQEEEKGKMIYNLFKEYNHDQEIIESKRRVMRLWPDKPSKIEIEDIYQRIKIIKTSQEFKQLNMDIANQRIQRRNPQNKKKETPQEKSARLARIKVKETKRQLKNQ